MPVNQDIRAEQGVLAAIFDAPEDLGLVANILKPEDFSEPRHELIYSSMLKLSELGKPYDPVSLAADLRVNGELVRAGSVEYIADLTDPGALYAYDADILGYAFIVKDEATKRRLKDAANKINSLSELDSGHTAEDAVAISETIIREIADVTVKVEALNAIDAFDNVLSEIKERESLPTGGVTGTPSGFVDLDRLTMGWQPGQFIIVAGRPGMGKSTLALDFARNASFRAGKSVLFFSLEMSKNELMQKLISAEARVELSKIRSGNGLTEEDWVAINAVKEQLKDATLIFDDTAKTTLAHIRTVANRQKQRPEGLDLIVVDYLQLMNMGGKVESRQQEVSEISRGSKILAKELEVPIISLSQLNRGSEQRADKSPAMSDLRESGSLEQDADMIILVHRPEYYDPNDRPGQAIVDLAKHRGGPTEKIPVIPLLQYSKFANATGMIPSMPLTDPEELAELPPDDGYDPDYVPPVESTDPDAPAW